MLSRRGGAHQRSRSGERQQQRELVEVALQEWQDEVEADESENRLAHEKSGEGHK